MITQKSFNYQFNDNVLNEFNFFVNETNFYPFNSLINNDSNLSFLYGPKKSGKTFLSKIWLKKNNGVVLKNDYEKFLNNTNNLSVSLSCHL